MSKPLAIRDADSDGNSMTPGTPLGNHIPLVENHCYCICLAAASKAAIKIAKRSYSFLGVGLCPRRIIPVLGMCPVIGRYSEAVPLRKNMKRTFKAQWPIGQVTIWRMAIRSPAMRLRIVKQITHGGTWEYPSSLLEAFNRSHVFAHRQ